jgi:outer membrane PBP1 activator LpoA protein
MLSLVTLIHTREAFMLTKHILTRLLMLSLGIFALNSCSTDTQPFMDHSTVAQNKMSSPPLASESLEMNSAFWQGNAATIWSRLQRVPLSTLQATNSSDPSNEAWIKLAIISKRDSLNSIQLAQDLIAWRAQYPAHAGNSLFPDNSTLANLQNPHVSQHIALLLPLQGRFAQQGKTVRDGFLNAYYSTLSSTHISQAVSFYDTGQTQDVSALYQKALADGADFIVGPLIKENVTELKKQGSFRVPILALNYTESGFGSSSNFYEFGLSPVDETQQVADKARSAGYSRAIIITTQDNWGHRVSDSLSSRWRSQGGSVQDVLYISPKMNLTQAIAGLLHVNPTVNNNQSAADNQAMVEQQRRHDFDVIFLLTPPQTAREVVPLLKYYYLNQLPIYATSIVYSGIPSPEKDSDLNGVIFSDTPWTLAGSGHSGRVYSVGLDAYALTHELQRLRTLPNFPLYGQTGALTLNSKQQIYRQLAWATIHDGRP